MNLEEDKPEEHEPNPQPTIGPTDFVFEETIDLILEEGAPGQRWEAFCEERNRIVGLLAETVRASIAMQDTPHPVFHGCFDWHSAVHGHWALLRAYRLTGDKELLDAVLASMTVEGMDRERAILESNPSFEMPYGRAWLLLLLQEYELVTKDLKLRPLGDSISKGLWAFLNAEAFDPAEDEYGNLSWAYLRLLDYLKHMKQEALLNTVRAKVRDELASARTVKLETDFSSKGFFSVWANYTDLLGQAYSPTGFLERLVGNPPARDALKPVTTIHGLHHLGINFSRAWGLWTAYQATKDERYLAAYIDHVQAGLALHEKWKDRYFQYSHWVPQFGIYAVTRSVYG